MTNKIRSPDNPTVIDIVEYIENINILKNLGEPLVRNYDIYL